MSVEPEPVTLTIDGKEVTVPKGTLVIRAAEQLGIEIPRFCDHPFLDPVGACRQCYVEIEGQRKLFTACTTEVAAGMVVHTQNTSELAHEGQVANLEFLLINHPLDCPICDRGGECPLQDQTMAFGPGESRYIEPKRVYRKPIPLSPLVLLDRERCVLCARCTRFCDQISGDRFIEMFARGAGQQVAIAAGEDFRSPFSGNTIQICPVGALTASTYRFVARPFDVHVADGICGHCSAGCNVRVDVRRGEVVRVLARDNAEVNDAWICDKGRFAFRAADGPGRVTTPLIRERGLEPASFDEVLGRVAEWSRGRGWPSSPGAAWPTRTRSRCPSSRGWRSAPTTSTTAERSTAGSPRSSRPRPPCGSLTETSSARGRSSSWAWMRSRRSQSCTFESARPPGAELACSWSTRARPG